MSKTEIIPPSDILEVGVCWPWIQGHFDHLFLDLDEACSLEHGFGFGIVGYGTVCSCCSIDEVLAPANQGRVCREGVVVAAGDNIDFDVLEPAISRLEMSGKC